MKLKPLRRHSGRRLGRWRACGGCGRGFVQDAVVNGEQRQLQPVRDADLVIHIAQVYG